ncbi:MAG: HEAT repeat domain-containing protein [Archangium sp.]|nr:HEAT repeat domain-containing protein [Archangium sp.]
MERLGVLLVLVGFSAWGFDRRAEAAEVLEKLYSGAATPQATATRLTFLGAQAFATEHLVDRWKRTTDAQRRSAMLEVLAEIATPLDEAESLLMRTVSDEELGHRMASAEALGRMKAKRAVSTLEVTLRDKAWGARKTAALALAKIGVASSGKALMAAARVEDDPDTRAVMLVAVGQVGAAKEKADLEQLLKHSSESTRLAAARALCLLGAPKGIAFAREGLKSSDVFQRQQAVRLFEGASTKVAAPVLTPVLRDSNDAVRATAARVLAQAGDASKVAWLVIESAHRTGEARLPYETELETLRLTDEARQSILRRAGLK